MSSATLEFTCAGCQHRDHAPRAVIDRRRGGLPFDLVQCPHCQLVQQFPRSSPAEWSRQYREDYYVFQESDERRWARAAQQYVVHILPIEAEQQGGRLLDIGCARGHFSALAARRGWRVTGLDVSAEAVSEASQRFGLDLRAGTLARHWATMPRYDVAFLGDVIEHVLDPAALLREVRSVLSPGGRIILDTPNWGGRWRRWGGARWLGLNPFHINLFTADSLSPMLVSSGFVEVRATTYTHYLYETWGRRPEVQRWVEKLPKFLAWRINRFLQRGAGRGTWAALRAHRPSTIDAASAFLSAQSGSNLADKCLQPQGDNLIVCGQRG